MQTKQWWLVGVTVAAMLAVPCLVRSQPQYPTQPVTLTVVFAAGGSADLVSRIVGDKLSAKFGQPFIIENRPGGGGEVGLMAVARSTPDGYRLLVTSNGPIAIAKNFRQVSYDVETDVVPVAMLEKTPCVVAVNASLPIKSVADLVKYSKDKTGGVSFGNSGPGSMFWVAGEILRHKTGANMVSVPYRGAALTARAIRAGEIDMGITDLTSVMPFVQEGTVRVLALTDSSRTPVAPDIPTLGESSIPGLGLNTWLGVFAPRGTPAPIVGQLNDGINEALKSPEVRRKILNAGLEPWIMSPQQMAEFVKEEIALWRDLMREANVTLQQ
jgi:tripartite-type tricarboxylate transporter receptor subunit TctC